MAAFFFNFPFLYNVSPFQLDRFTLRIYNVPFPSIQFITFSESGLSLG